ncbi:MAG TPA: hypothetical protein DEQ78_05235 [Ruminococcaceae bacterium]|jgi:hypothetical protein|nr:hypothetical protein [Oscillospiraceae bacterium]HCE26666.1 hypothetical protein [Oscillospiraceae bacterium]
MKMKKWVLGLIAFAAMVVICAVCAGAERYGDFQYSVLEDDTVEIIWYTGNAENVEIPSKIEDSSVTGIRYYAFRDCENLRYITIPSSVKNIDDGAFVNCPNLTEITVKTGNLNYTSVNGVLYDKNKTTLLYYPKGKNDKNYKIIDGVTSIRDSTFMDNTFLVDVDIPDSVTSIGRGAFENCTSLTNVNIPNNVTDIGDSAFSNTALISITIPEKVTNVSYAAFSSNTHLVSVKLSDGVTQIGDYCFSGCTSLTKIDVTAGNKYFSSVNGVLFDKNKTEIIWYPAGIINASYRIPDGVTGISNYAFNKCIHLTSVTIPDSVTDIGEHAFDECSSLKSITIPDRIKGIKDYTFNYCENLAHVTIPDSVTYIGKYAFDGCTSLKNITLPDTVTNIDYGAFMFCNSLKSITIPESVQDIGEYAFYGCKSLEKINAAAGNENYVSVNGILFSKDKTKIVCYPANKNDTSYSIPSSVKVIGSGAFRDCSHLKSIMIPNSVTTMEHHAFSNCTSLTSISIPDGIKTIEMGTFDYCKSLTSVRIPDSVTEIGHSAFYCCDNLKSITIPRSVTEILSYALGLIGLEDRIDGFKIYCYSGTEAELYAKGEKFNYVLLDKLPTLAKVTGSKLSGRAADALRINWTKNASADGYIVEMYQGNKWVRVAKITNNNTTTFRKAGLKAGTVYKFRVKAYKMYDITADYGEYSATVTARTNPSVIKGAKLGGRAADALRINWTKNASADGYIVEMYQGNKWVRVAKITKNRTTTFRKAGLKASTVYKFRVRAYKMSGKTALYGNYSATVTARTNPSIMKGVKIGGKAKDALRVNWTKNTSAQGYIVEMYKGGKWVRVAKITNSNTTTFRKAGLAKNTAYKFRVRAYHMSGKAALYGNYGSVSGKTAVK